MKTPRSLTLAALYADVTEQQLHAIKSVPERHAVKLVSRVFYVLAR